MKKILVADDSKIIGNNIARQNAGLKIVELVRRTLKQTLAILGIAAPSKM